MLTAAVGTLGWKHPDCFKGNKATNYKISLLHVCIPSYLRKVCFFSRFNDEVKHIKVIEKDSWIHITEAKKFESLLVSQSLCVGTITSSQSKMVWFCLFILSQPTQQELVEYYQTHSLKESFKLLDTTLRYPYKSRERSLTRASTRSPGRLSLASPLPGLSVYILVFLCCVSVPEYSD